MAPILLNHITTDSISSFFGSEILVDILRLDKIHPVISGNKWFKLRYHLEEAQITKKKHIITFGGAWSNHIVAAAAACNDAGLRSTGLIRGEEPAIYSDTLEQAKSYGMQLLFLTREDYKKKIIPASLYDNESYIIPEGGYSPLGAKGTSTLLNYSNKNYTHYCCAVGTGTMIAGIINASENQKTIGISVLKNNYQSEDDVQSLLKDKEAEWQIIHDYHCGGYAKQNSELLSFMNEFYSQTRIPTDFVYTGKLIFAVKDLIKKKYFPPDSRILIIHSGGLQGNASLPKGALLF